MYSEGRTVGDDIEMLALYRESVNHSLLGMIAYTDPRPGRDIVLCGEYPTIGAWEYYKQEVATPKVTPIPRDPAFEEAIRAYVMNLLTTHMEGRRNVSCLGNNHCRGCYYSGEGKYCGLGRDMVEGCPHKVDSQQA